jgi:hypothetical protein
MWLLVRVLSVPNKILHNSPGSSPVTATTQKNNYELNNFEFLNGELFTRNSFFAFRDRNGMTETN